MKVEEGGVHHKTYDGQNSEIRFQRLPKHHPF
jgi:hypothetical protein